MTKTNDVTIIGGGAAGLMCAIEAGKRQQKVLVLEHANKPGKKILMSGGGLRRAIRNVGGMRGKKFITKFPRKPVIYAPRFKRTRHFTNFFLLAARGIIVD